MHPFIIFVIAILVVNIVIEIFEEKSD